MPAKILIIDDNKSYTSILQERLERCDCKTCHAPSSKSGLDTLRSQPSNHFDIVITDITMETQVSGIFLVRRIRRLGFNGCLIIYSTGFNFPLVLQLSRLFFRFLGADGLIPKNRLIEGKPQLTPITRNPLLDLVDKAFS